MMIEDGLGDRIALFDQQPKLARLVVDLKRLWTANITLGIRTHLRQLAMFIAVALRSADIARAFQNQKPDRPLDVAIAMNHTPRNHQIIAAPEWQLTKLGFEHTLAVADVDQLISLSVAIEEIILRLRLNQQRADVIVK